MKSRTYIIISCIGILSLLSQQASAQWVAQNSGVIVTLTDVTMIDTATAVVVGYNGTILKTTDAGKHWIIKKSNTQNDLNAVSFRSALNGHAVGNGVVCHTTDGGETWDTSSVIGNYISVASGGYPLAPAVYMGSDHGRIRFTYDEGKTWIENDVDGDPIVSITNKTALNSTLTLFASNYGVYQTFNGLQWSLIKNHFIPLIDIFAGDLNGSTLFLVGGMYDPGVLPVVVKRSLADTVWHHTGGYLGYPFYLSDVQAFPDTSIVYVCGYSNVYKSVDTGNTFQKETVPTKQFLKHLSFITLDRGFVVGDSGVIFYTTNGGLTTVQSKEPDKVPPSPFLSPNYPNPFNPTTKIQYSVDHSNPVTVNIYNSMGQEVQSLLSAWREPGDYTITWDATEFASGIYYCRLTVGNFSAVQKMILTK
jgi:photosystem II stability/assembly factor-like uncharacterized protein